MSQQLHQFPKDFVFTLISKEQHEIQVLASALPSKRNNSYFQGAAGWQFHLDVWDQLSPAPVLKARVLLWREQRSVLRVSGLSTMTRGMWPPAWVPGLSSSLSLRPKTCLCHFTANILGKCCCTLLLCNSLGRWKSCSWLLLYGRGYSSTPEWQRQKGKWVQGNPCGEGLSLSSAFCALWAAWPSAETTTFFTVQPIL